MIKLLQQIVEHPLTKNKKMSAVARFIRWQIESRIRGELEIEWIDGARFIAKRRMWGITGNIYCGMQEFEDMAFVMHFLRPADTFVDVGANVGAYTIISSKICGARSIAIEPDPLAAAHLRKNLLANDIEDRVQVEEVALGAEDGTVAFTIGLDTMNRVASSGDRERRQVRMRRLDSVVDGLNPALIKMDVEGFERQVVAGAARTLNNPSLRAIESETVDPLVRDLLRAAGFEEVFYEPFSRKLSREPAGAGARNALFVRNIDECQMKVSAAPRRMVLGQEI